MPKLFRVTHHKTIKSVLSELLTARTSDARRTAALDAIRRANPTLDLNKLKPGTVLVIPDVPGLRKSADDPVGDVADDVVERVRADLETLLTASTAADEARRREREETDQLLDSTDVGKLGGFPPVLDENIESLKRVLEQDDADADKQLAQLKEAVGAWSKELDELRGLL